MCKTTFKQSKYIVLALPECLILFIISIEQGASKNGTTPDGKTYLESAEKDEIRELLK